ncbi:hypothetical protein R1A27_34790 (plasmid) [Methylobacterium sp. NMS12]|uniref:hypothetical protein n=1 Tax=Methylobacterium sp. NMS12 TaxID=3079766 RepID=UPI003F884B3C
MSTATHRIDPTSPDAVQALREALAGAFVEGVDLGSRGEQIRQLGLTLEAMIEALRIRLAELGAEVQIDGRQLDLVQLARMARAARTYRMEEGVRFDHGPISSLPC